MTKWLYGSWIPVCGLDNGNQESVHYDTLYFQVPSLMLPLGYTGHFVRSIVCQVPVLLYP